MSQLVFLHYTQAELDRNFDQRGWIANAEEIIARYATAAAATRARFTAKLDVAYGAHADETLDVFLTERSIAPIAIFVHGGRWVNFTKADNSFVADPLVPAGAHCVVLNFSKLPGVRLPTMVDQVERGIEWVAKNARSFGGDASRIYLFGHSSGAHLAANALVADWPARGVPADVIKGALLASGPYDLEPVMLSARSSYVKLAPDEVARLSPQQQAHRIPCPAVLAYAENDTDEFRRQSEAYAEQVRAAGKLVDFFRVPKLNHFEIMETFGDANAQVTRALLKLMKLV